MHHIYLKDFGPVAECNMDIDNCIVITGAQASGKSTIAKAIYYFRTIKDDIVDAVVQNNTNGSDLSLFNAVVRQLRSKFLQMFGTSKAMSGNMRMRYDYSQTTYIEVSLKTEAREEYISSKFIYFDFSENINDFLNSAGNNIDNYVSKDDYATKLNALFDDEYETVFIPAGRSLITLLTSQLNYIFTMMNDDQKRSLDYPTQKYVERILKIRTLFTEGIWGYYESKRVTSINPINHQAVKRAMSFVIRILKGEYQFASGEERLNLENGRFVKLNYISSGQQETVWIFNILLYQLINNIKTFVILEEPEAHLYPESQKDITELLALFLNSGNSVFLTTHSPYLLGALNNLLYAHFVAAADNSADIEQIVPEAVRLKECHAYYIERGKPVDCFDESVNLIDNGVIDGASHTINEIYDKLSELEGKGQA